MNAALAPWHDVQQGGYAEDLPLWRALASVYGPALELGAGTGRVALDVARAARQPVWALDYDRELVDACQARADRARVPVVALQADARDFHLDRGFPLVYAPTSFVQIIGGRDDRLAMLRCVRAHLKADGVACLAVMDLNDVVPSDPYRLRRGRAVYESAVVNVEWVADGVMELMWSRVVEWRAPRRRRRHFAPLTVRYEQIDDATITEDAGAAGLECVRRYDLASSEWARQWLYVLVRA